MDIKQLQRLYNASDSNIEDYPDDFPHPSCLIFGYTEENKVLHIVVGSNGDTIFFITAYYPNTDKFETDLKTRKEQ